MVEKMPCADAFTLMTSTKWDNLITMVSEQMSAKRGLKKFG
jgi:hypothetical protein